jgi:hypothetical protein
MTKKQLIFDWVNRESGWLGVINFRVLVEQAETKPKIKRALTRNGPRHLALSDGQVPRLLRGQDPL